MITLSIACGGGGGGGGSTTNITESGQGSDTIEVGSALQKITIDISEIGLSQRSKAVNFDDVATVVATFMTTSGNVEKTLTHEEGTMYSTTSESLEVGAELTMNLAVTMGDGTVYDGSAQLTIPASGENTTVEVILTPGTITIDGIAAIEINGFNIVEDSSSYYIEIVPDITYDSRYVLSYSWEVEGDDASWNPSTTSSNALEVYKYENATVTLTATYTTATNISAVHTEDILISSLRETVHLDSGAYSSYYYHSDDEEGVELANLEITAKDGKIYIQDLAFDAMAGYVDDNYIGYVMTYVDYVFHDNLQLFAEYDNDGFRYPVEFTLEEKRESVSGNLLSYTFADVKIDGEWISIEEGELIQFYVQGDVVQPYIADDEDLEILWQFSQYTSKLYGDNYGLLTYDQMEYSRIWWYSYLNSSDSSDDSSDDSTDDSTDDSSDSSDGSATASIDVTVEQIYSNQTVIAGATHSMLSIDITANNKAQTLVDLPIFMGNLSGGMSGYRAVESISLFNTDGTAIEYPSGADAILSGISTSSDNIYDGYLIFTDLDLAIAANVTQEIIVKATFRTVGDDSLDSVAPGTAMTIGVDTVNADMWFRDADGEMTIPVFSQDLSSVQVLASQLVITQHAQSPDTVGDGSDVEVYRMTITNPANYSYSDAHIHDIAFRIDADESAQISNVVLRDATDPSSSITTGTLIREHDGIYHFNFPTPYEISNGTSETLFITCDISNFDFTDQITVQPLAHGSASADVDVDNLSDTSLDFGELGSAGMIYSYEEEGDVKRWVSDQEDFDEFQLSGF